MTELLIESCSDPLLWYADKVGSFVRFVREDEQYYWARETLTGPVNIVYKQDATLYD